MLLSAAEKETMRRASKNKALILGMFEDFFNRHELAAADRYMHPDYIQHDFDVPDGREGFKAHFEKVFALFPAFRVDILHIVEEGDMLIMHGYGVTDPGKIEVLVVDTYKVKDGLLYEHWGTVQPLPPEQFGNPRLF